MTGAVVSDEEMAELFGSKTDPVTGGPLGSRHRIHTSVADRLETARGEHERWAAEDLADRAVGLRVASRPGARQRDFEEPVEHREEH